MLRRGFAALLAFSFSGLTAHADQICAWLVESNQPGNVRKLDLWLQSDANVDFVYKVTGRGIVTIAGDANSPLDSTYHLDPNQPRQAWSYASTFYPPGKIEITVEIDKLQRDVYSTAPTLALAAFAFKREVPASEKSPPDTLARQQCLEIVTGGLPL